MRKTRLHTEPKAAKCNAHTLVYTLTHSCTHSHTHAHTRTHTQAQEKYFNGTGDSARGNGVHQGGEGKYRGDTKRLRESGNAEDLAKLEEESKRYKNLEKTHKCTEVWGR